VRLVVVAALLLLVAPGSAQDSPLVSGWSGSSLGDLLSRPLPGTPERADDDLARALERALIGFVGIDRARVIVTSRETEDASPPSRSVAVQLTLADDHAVDPRWVQGIVDFITSAVPELDARNLTIVDASGNTLYARSVVAVSSPSPTTAGTDAPKWRAGRQGWVLTIAAVAGCVVIIAALLLLSGRGGTERRPPEPEPQPGPFAFLESLDDDELRHVIADERPEVVALVAHHLGDAQRDRVRAVIAQQLPPVAATEPDAEVVAVIAAALRGKLVES